MNLLVLVELVEVELMENKLVMVEEAPLIRICFRVVVGESVMPSERSSNALPKVSLILA